MGASLETGSVLQEAKRLYDSGMAIHWLHKKSKRPVESGWTTGPRKTWKQLVDTYRPDYNVGVRLGEASKIKGDNYAGFLAAIDTDIKSTSPKHLKEAKEKLETITHGQLLPRVASGRGNGSEHLYFATPEPLAPFKVVHSEDIVKVFMPSAEPSKRELSALTPEELKAGLRLRYAWEISVMGEGQQVVLPPSLHPDSGAAYRWLKEWVPRLALDFDSSSIRKPAPVNVGKSVDSVDSSSSRKLKPEDLGSFEVEVVDLSWLPIPKNIRAMILTGEGADDRSAALLPVARALRHAGLTRNEILSVLTDPKTYLGCAAYDHAKTRNRARAAAWVYNYTLKKVEASDTGEALFREPIEKAAPLTPEEVASNQDLFEETEELTAAGGFYFIGRNGGLVPDYAGLFEEFKMTHPFKTISEMKAVYVFDETHYKPFTPVDIKGFAEDHFDPKPAEKTRLEFLNKVLANNIEHRDFFISTTENKINFNNGVLKLDEGFMGPELVEHSPEFGFRGVLPYDYDLEATCPFFDKWIDGVMLGDKDLVAVLQEYMGFIVRGGDYKYHKALWLGGTGRNGKSTFIDLLKALIGAGNFSTISIKSLMGDKFAGADLDGKIANFSEETSPQELADSGPFKNLTGDGEIFAQKKYGDPYSFRNRAKLIMTYNTIPDLKDLSAGMLSRPIIIPFRKIIKDEAQDRSIKQKLFKELSGIFNFALAGWDRLEEQNGFTKSELSEQALRRVREESCNVFQWVEHNVDALETFDQYDLISPAELYEAYRKKESYPFKAIEFYRRLNDHPSIEKHKKRTAKGMVYFGLKINR